MTALEFIRSLVQISKDHAKDHDGRIFAVDFAPSPEGLSLTFHFHASKEVSP